MLEEIREKLYGLAEEDYKEFNKKLIPGVEHVADCQPKRPPVPYLAASL